MTFQWKKTLDDFQAKNGGHTILLMIESYGNTDRNVGYYGNNTRPGAHIPVSCSELLEYKENDLLNILII